MDSNIIVINWDWAYFILGMVAAALSSMLRTIITRHWNYKREQKFLKRVSVMYPGSSVEVITVSGSDKEALEAAESQLKREDNPLRSYPKYHRASEADRTEPYSEGGTQK